MLGKEGRILRYAYSLCPVLTFGDVKLFLLQLSSFPSFPHLTLLLYLYLVIKYLPN